MRNSKFEILRYAQNDNPSDFATLSHLPLRKGGFGECRFFAYAQNDIWPVTLSEAKGLVADLYFWDSYAKFQNDIVGVEDKVKFNYIII